MIHYQNVTKKIGDINFVHVLKSLKMCKLSIFVVSNDSKLMPNIPLKIESEDTSQILGLIQSDHAGYASFHFGKNYFLVEQVKPTWFLEDIDVIRNLVVNALHEPLNENEQVNFESQSWFNISRKISDIYLKGYPISFYQALPIFGIPIGIGFEKLYTQSYFQEYKNQYLELSQPRYLPLNIKISLLSPSDTTNKQSIGIDPNTDKIVITISATNNIVEAAPNTFPSYYPNPDMIDRTVSPNSFSNKTTLTIGQDGCEELMHNALAERKFFFKEIVVGERVAWKGDGMVDNIRIAKLVTFGSNWYPLGHALGEIIYSLPLAPAEQVNIAVIDWKREDSAQRSDSILYTEQLNHNQQRDRMVEETVTAALRERQSTQSSTIGGSVGVSAFGIGASVSAAHSWSDSEGSRDTEANSLQNLSDGFQQASSNVRSMYSTVVVQTAQNEKATAQTRTVRNYNHSHALTVLYYEVLRQYRIENEISNTEDLLMIKFTLFKEQNLINFYPLIRNLSLSPELFKTFENLAEPDLVYYDTDMLNNLDQNYLAGFNVTIKSKKIIDPSFGEDSSGSLNHGIMYLLIETTDGKIFAKKMESRSDQPAYGEEIDLGYFIENKNWLQFDIINKNKASEWDTITEIISSVNAIKSIGIFSGFYLGSNSGAATPPGEISFRDTDWDGIRKIEWHLNSISVKSIISNSAFQEDLLSAKGEADAPLFVFTKEKKISYYISNNITKSLIPQKEEKVDRRLNKPASFDNLRETISSHIIGYQDYYRRKIVENLGPDYFAKVLELIPVGSSANITLFDLVNPKPVEMIGEYVVFKFYPKPEVEAFQEGLQLDILNKKSEAFISLPTRGVFAETKLSHCNASEKIDETRFWKWEEHPIPDLAPQITPVSTDSRNQTPNLTPTHMPNSNLTIVNPPAAPDPTGLTSSLNLLGSLGAFNLAQGDQQNVNSAIQGNLNNVGRFAELNAQLEMQRRAQQQVDQNLRRNREAFERGDITREQFNDHNSRAIGGAIDGHSGLEDSTTRSNVFDNESIQGLTNQLQQSGGRLKYSSDSSGNESFEMESQGQSNNIQLISFEERRQSVGATDFRTLSQLQRTNALMYAQLCDQAYLNPDRVNLGNGISGGWSHITQDIVIDDDESLTMGELQDSSSGFFSRIFHSDQYGYALCFRGSEININDWITNFQQFFTAYEQQYTRAIHVARKFNRIPSETSERKTLCGHSLGGGLASVGAVFTGLKTYTFNSAGVRDATLSGSSTEQRRFAQSEISAYYLDGEILSSSQDSYPTRWIFPRAMGRRIIIPSEIDSLWPGQREIKTIAFHTIGEVITHLQQYI